MVKFKIPSASVAHRLRHVLLITGISLASFAGLWHVQAQQGTFFRTDTKAPASSVQGPSNRRVTNGPTPPSLAGRRAIEPTKLTIPENQQAGRRQFGAKSGFTPQVGASAKGARRVPTSTK